MIGDRPCMTTFSPLHIRTDTTTTFFTGSHGAEVEFVWSRIAASERREREHERRGSERGRRERGRKGERDRGREGEWEWDREGLMSHLLHKDK